ncbi:glycosyltransferase [Neobacillus sp. D3-1R]|uniref:glycosyltransferase n=1 Tax=Neobacillus sp. D3-1R TaxID=3445778 RepID=UPI003FA16ED7
MIKNTFSQADNNILISVVIPLYNVEKYMEKCIDSVLNQTLSSIEVILVDDGSPDSSGDIADSYLEKDSRIKVIHKENGGLSLARNEGIQAATGKYIIFIDSDDWVDKNLLKKAYDRIEETNSEICVFNVIRIHEDSKETIVQGKDMDEEIDINSYGVENYINSFMLNPKSHRYSAWNRLYNLQFLRENRLFFEPNNEIHSEDMLFNLECCLYLEKVCSIKDPLYFHLLRSGTISSSKKPDITKKLMNLCKRFIEKAHREAKYSEVEGVVPNIVQYLFFMSMGSEINSNKGNFKAVYTSLNWCYNYNFFKPSMKLMGKKKLNKRNFISFLLGNRLKFISSVVVYNVIRSKL